MASNRQSLFRRFTDQLAVFQASRDAFTVFARATAAGITTELSTSANTSTSASSTSRQPQLPPRTLIVLDSSFNPPTRAHMRMAISAIRSAAEAAGKDEKGSTSSSTGTRAGGSLGDIRLLLLLAVNNADKAAKPAAFPVRMEMMGLFALDLLDAVGCGNGDQGQGQDLVQSNHPEGGGKGGDTGDGTGGVSGFTCTIDMGLTSLPYFHEKSRVIAESGFYKDRDSAGHGSGATDTGSSTAGSASASASSQQVILAGYDTLIRILDPKYYVVGNGGMRAALDPFFARARLRITMRADDQWGGEEEQRRYLRRLKDGALEAVGGRAEWCERVEMVEGTGEEVEAVVVSSTRVREAAKKGDGEALEGLVGARVKRFLMDEKTGYAEG